VTLSIGICGGGIGGLCAAIALASGGSRRSGLRKDAVVQPSRRGYQPDAERGLRPRPAGRRSLPARQRCPPQLSHQPGRRQRRGDLAAADECGGGREIRRAATDDPPRRSAGRPARAPARGQAAPWNGGGLAGAWRGAGGAWLCRRNAGGLRRGDRRGRHPLGRAHRALGRGSPALYRNGVLSRHVSRAKRPPGCPTPTPSPNGGARCRKSRS
jgi:hypothetical protein